MEHDEPLMTAVERDQRDEDFLAPEPGANPVVGGVSVAGGGATGAAVGLVIGGPIGGVIGAIVGALAGGLSDGALVQVAAVRSDALAEEGRGIAPKHEDIAARAFGYYAAEGYPSGRDLEHWLRSERELSESVCRNDPVMVAAE